MDKKNLLPPNNGEELQTGQRISPSNEVINIKSESKQMTSVNSNEPKRVIKQIVSLDSKKLKALGIESNILSALTKFNGSEKIFHQKKSSITVNCVQPSTSAVSTKRVIGKTIQSQPTISPAAISPVRPIIALQGSLAQSKIPKTPTEKKIHVLSDVLLSENKLDLKEFTAIASSTPVSTNISYVPQVPKPSQIQSDVKDEEEIGESFEISTVDTVVESIEKINSPKKSQEIDALKGYSVADLKRSQNQYEHLRSKITTKFPNIQSVSNESEFESEFPLLIETQLQIKAEPNVGIETSMDENKCLSTINTTSEKVYSSDSSSGSNSDLDELIKEAQMTIENELITDTESTDESPLSIKKPKLVKKELLDLLVEHFDKDKLIDEFLDSTMNSFHTRCDSPSNSYSSDEHFDSANIGVQSNSEEECEALENNSKSEGNNFNTIDDKPSITQAESTKQRSDVIDIPTEAHKTRKRRSRITTVIRTKRRRSKTDLTNQMDYLVESKVETTDQTIEHSTINHGESMYEQTKQPLVQTPEIKEEASSHKMSTEQKSSQKQGRKPKQTILNEFFPIQSVEKSESKEPQEENTIKNAPVRSSRYGRIIKPKSLDIQSTVKVKSERKSSKETIDSSAVVQEIINSDLESTPSIVKPLKKRGGSKMYDSILDESSDIDELPSGATDFTSTSLSFKLFEARRNSAERLLGQINVLPLSALQSNKISCSTVIVPKRRGRPSKKFIVDNTPIDVANEMIPSEEQIGANVTLPYTNDESLILNEQVTNEELPRRRGLRLKKPKLETSVEESIVDDLIRSSFDDSVNMDDSSMLHETSSNDIKQFRNQPSVDIENNLKNTETSVQLDHEETPVKRRGRPRIKPIKSVEMIIDPNEPKFTCGNCQLEVAKSKWRAHESIHFGVTWRVGIDDPVEVDDTSTQSRIMIRYMKHNKIAYLKCSKCGEKKKLCGLTEEEVKSLKEECQYCNKLYRKVSLPSHQQSFCTVRRLELAQQKADEMVKTVCETIADEQQQEVIYSETGRPKRIIKKPETVSKSVDEFIKVGIKITGGTFKHWQNQLKEDGIIECSNENCTFTSTDIVGIQRHSRQCRESIHQCKICQFVEGSRDKIVEHIESTHPNELRENVSEDEADNSDDDDFNGNNQSSSSSDDGDFDDYDEEEREHSIKKSSGRSRQRNEPLKRIMEEDSPLLWEMVSTFHTRILNTRPGYYRKSYEWTKEFMEQNYDLDELILKSHMRSEFDHVRLPQRELNKFLGLLNFKSPSFDCQTETEYTLNKAESVEGNWQHLNLFKSIKSEHTKLASSVIFCGGKIMSAEWIPFPKDYVRSQVLAICAQNKEAKPTSLTNHLPQEKCKNLIQLWKVTTSTDSNIDTTDFMYAVAYEDGPIQTMSFCPSDAYIASKRLAIVALPDTNGNINIISLPENVSKTKSNVPSVIKVKSDIKLQLGFSTDEHPSQVVTQIAWSRTKGHQTLCAGFNTGLVAIWNFEHLNSSVMCKKDNSDAIPVVIPQYTFMGALSYITHLDLHPNNDGRTRWVLVGAIDRRIRLYDLYDPQLTPFTSQVFKSRIITGTWPLHWPIYLTVTDASLSRMNGGLHIKPVLYTNNQPRSVNLFIDCEPSNLAFSDWLNTGIFGNDIGDLFVINFQQLLLHDRYDESTNQNIISCTDVFTNEHESCESNEQLKVLFRDFDEAVLAPRMNTRIPPVDQHPYTRITRVTINPNESHHKLYAVGYELGFCRIHSMP